MRASIVIAIALLALFPFVYMPDISDASSTTIESERVLITNVYGSEFVSLGTIDETEHENSGLFLFIEGSERHEMFKRYIEGASKFAPNDDWMLIQEGTNVHAYFFDSNTYQEWNTLITFEDSSGNVRFLSVGFTIERPIDELNFFFLKGSTAEIQWMNMESAAVTAYFNGAELKTSDVSIPIDTNGAYSLKFVTVSDSDGVISTTVSYTIGGFDDSRSMTLATVCWFLALVGFFGILLLHRGPGWSGKGGLN